MKSVHISHTIGTTRIYHSEELPWRHNHMVTKPPSNNRVVHNRLVGLVLKIRVPARAEFLAGPAVHHGEFFLCGPDLDTGFDAVGGERARAVDIPLLEDLFLHFGVAADEIVEGLDVRFGAVGCECEAGVT
jgi:hypothetical protein